MDAWGLSVVMEVVQLPAGETTQAGAWGGEALRWPAPQGCGPAFPDASESLQLVPASL